MTKPDLSHAAQRHTILPRQLPGLTRFDYQRTQGWLARYYAVRQVVHQRLFSDSRYAWDPVRSRAAACRWLLAYSATTAPRPRFRNVARSNTGLVGICRRWKRERSGRRVLVYDVSYQRDGKRCTKTFRVNHYSSQRAALAFAVTFRRCCEEAMTLERLRALQQVWEQESMQVLQERSGDVADARP